MLHSYHALCSLMPTVIVQYVYFCCDVVIGQGNEPQWEQGGAQSGGTDTYSFWCARKKNVCLAKRLTWAIPPHSYLPLSLRLTSLICPSQTLSNTATISTTLAITLVFQSVTFIFGPYWAVLFYNALYLSLSLLLLPHPVSLSFSGVFFFTSYSYNSIHFNYILFI